MRNALSIFMTLVSALTLTMCTPAVPGQSTPTGAQPKIYPDYTDLDIPANIAPLNFNIEEKGDEYITRLYNRKGAECIVGGRTLDIDVDRWHQLLADSRGDTVYVDVYVKGAAGWSRFAPIKYYVAEEIDPYISYRLIEPLYVNYEILRICQRNIESFDVRDIYNNCAHLDVEGNRQCMNCHSYQAYNKDGAMQMHTRVLHPGTVIIKDGKPRKVNMKVGDLYSPAVYPCWHPSGPYIAYSINDTWQHFHSVDRNKVEVQDAASGIILYNTDTNTVEIVADSPTELETFPAWSADGLTLYYSSATVPELTKEEMANYRMTNYKDFKYNVMQRRFDAQTGRFAEADTLFNAAALGKSATFARESPDGRYILFTVGEYGTFHNFHHDADIYIMDKTTGEISPLSAINSNDTECYHSWSSNGRWIIFSTRRDNGVYTRFYIAHFDKDGRATKPFKLPQRSPSADDMLFKSYNVPEFMVKPVDLTREQMTEIVESEPVDAIYKE